MEEPASQAKGRTMSGGITVPVPMEGGSVSLREGRLGIVLVEPVPRGEEDVGGPAGEFRVSCPSGGPVGHVQPRLVVGGHVLHTRDSVLKPECDRVAVIATELHEVLRRDSRLRLSSFATGDRWCGAESWTEAYEAGGAPPAGAASTNSGR